MFCIDNTVPWDALEYITGIHFNNLGSDSYWSFV
jgi:hypothetical protein